MLWPKTKLPMFLSFLDITVAMVTADKYQTKKKKKKWSEISPIIDSFSTVVVAIRKLICFYFFLKPESSADSNNITL